MLEPPVILTLPTAPKLAIPLTVNPVNVPKLVILPCDAVITLPLKFPVIVPVAFIVPATLTPVPVTTNILALPTALILTLPFAIGILTLLLPLTTVTPALKLLRLLPSPYRYCALIKPLLAYTLPLTILPVTFKLVNVPTLVIFGCAFVVTVPAVLALP